MNWFKILNAVLVTSMFSASANAVDECAFAREKLQDNIAKCALYKSQNPSSFTWKVFMTYNLAANRMQQMCLGAQPDDPAGAYTINYYGDPLQANCFQGPVIVPPPIKKATQTCGSIIETANRVVGETIPLIGSSFNLVYFSNRVVGKRSDYIVNIPISAGIISPTTTNYNLEIKNEINATIFNQSYLPVANTSYQYEWNGLDNSLNEAWAKTKRTFTLSETATDFNPDPQFFPHFIGNLKAKKLGTGAWLPSVWHFYDAESQTLYKGDGTLVTVKGVQDGSYTRIADQQGKEVFYFDNTGKISHTRTALTGSMKYTFAYDAAGRLLTITEPFNKVTTFSRYVSGVLKAIVAPNGAKASITMNADGYMSKLVNPNNETFLMTYYGSGGLLNTFMSPDGDITTLTYDTVGNLVSDVHGSGFSATISEVPTGLKSTSAEGRFTYTSSVNELNEKIKTANGLESNAYHDFNTDQYSTPTGQRFYYYQNDPRFGNQIQLLSGTSIDNFGSRNTNFSKEVVLGTPGNPYSITSMIDIETIFNAKKTSTYVGSTRTTTSTTKLGRTEKIQIDEYERPIMIQKGELVAKDYTYTNNLLTKITQGTRKQVMSYYSNDLLKSIRNSLDEVTTFTYDASQRLKTKILPDSRVITYNYDSNGNVASITPPGRSEHQFEFGLNGMMTSYNPPLVSGTSSVNTNYTYNNDKQLTKITRPDGQEIEYNYQSSTGLLTSITGDFGSIAMEHSKDLPFSYSDQDGQVIYQFYTGTIPNSHRFMKNGSYIYEYERTPTNNAGEKIGQEIIKGSGPGSVTRIINHSYDHDEVKTKVGDLSLIHNVPNGQLSETTLGHFKDYYYYNAFGELRKYVAKYRSNVIYEYELQRDSTGRITKKIETLNNVSSTYDYIFDSAGRLVQVSTNGVVSSSYNYDDNSNRIGGVIRGEVVSGVYDQQDRLTNYNNISLTYNANDEILTNGNSNYTYDVFGSLKQFSKASLSIDYEIDPLHRRYGRIVNGQLTSRLMYNPENQVIGQLDANNKLIKTFVYATKSHVPDYYIDQKNNKFKIITDHLGSVRLVVSNSGRVLQMMEHDEFGRVLQDTRPGFLPFGFAGGLYEYRTGLVRFGARDYDPETNRWLSKDPIRFDGGDTNLYGYVMSDPINGIDPNGENTAAIGGGLVGIGFGIGEIGGIGIGVGVGVTGPGAIIGGIGMACSAGAGEGSDEVPKDKKYCGDQLSINVAACSKLDSNSPPGQRTNRVNCLTRAGEIYRKCMGQ